MRRPSAALALTILLGLAPLSRAHAQGTELGADIGLGVLFADGNSLFQAATPTSFRVGFPLARALRLEPRTNLLLVSGEGETAVSFAMQPALLLQLSPRRIGGAYIALLPGISVVDAFDESETQFSFGGGIGVRVPQGNRFALRLEGQYTRNFETDVNNVQALIGFSFFTR
jgi:hypothetical protein